MKSEVAPGAPRTSAVSAEPLPHDLDWLAALDVLRRDPYSWWLDSALAGPGAGRFSFAGSDPYLVMRARGHKVALECRRAVRSDLAPGRTLREAEPLATLRALLPPAPAVLDAAQALPPFIGGAVGYLGYELAEHCEPLRLHGRDDLGLPDLVMLFPDRLLARDHREGRCWSLGLGLAGTADDALRHARAAASELAKRFASVPRRRFGGSRSGEAATIGGGAVGVPADAEVLFDEQRYAAAVRTVLREIAAGNVYQADLTHRLSLPFAGDPWQLYRALRGLSPAPYAAWLELPEVAVASSSPELFLALDGEGRVTSRPIKGTRPRGASPAADAAQRAELERSEKDRAENLMIVDLVRNDLGRVCRTGSVEVAGLMEVESYASVHQLVSTVRGRLREDRDALDLVRASFPPGSMTGAPKLAAMRLLDRLEPVRRGIYSGALGYLDVRGGLALSVVIRTALVAAGRAWIHVGGGIVADSVPVAEHRETLDKARALFEAVELARR